MMGKRETTNQVRGRECQKLGEKQRKKCEQESWVPTLEERGKRKKTSGTKQISEACLYLIRTLPQFKERDTQLLYDVRRWVRCATATDEKQHNSIF